MGPPAPRVIEEMTLMTLPLREYQREAIDAINASPATRNLVALPTGTGKTVVFSHWLAEREGRSIVLLHRQELIDQTQAKMRAIAPHVQTGVVKAERDEVTAQVVLASVQTLARPNRLANVAAQGFQSVVVDEAHHATATTWMRSLRELGSFSGVPTVGFTATPERGDGKGLGEVWERIVYQRGIREMIAQGYLVPIRGQQVGTDFDFSNVKVSRGDYTDSSLETEMERADVFPALAEGFCEYARDRKAVAFTPTVRSAELLALELRMRDVAAEVVHGGTPPEERAAILARLDSGDTQVVCNCMVLTEGFDSPSVDCIVIARPTRAHSLYIQMIGRGTRIHPGKDDLLVLDMSGATDRHDLVTITDLRVDITQEMDEDPDEDAPVMQQVCPVCLEPCTDHRCKVCNRYLGLGAIDAGERFHQNCRSRETKEVDLMASHMKWLPLEPYGWCLPVEDGAIVAHRRDDGLWDVVSTTGGPRKKPVRLYDGLPLGYAQGVGEDLARASGKIATRGEYWNLLEPTNGQLYFMRQLGFNDRALRLVNTRGEASDLITRRLAQKKMAKGVRK